MKIHLHYFAQLREEAGRSSESMESGCRTVAELYNELQSRRGLSLKAGHLRAAVNGEFVPFDAPLKEGDTVVFIPPVSGG